MLSVMTLTGSFIWIAIDNKLGLSAYNILLFILS